MEVGLTASGIIPSSLQAMGMPSNCFKGSFLSLSFPRTHAFATQLKNRGPSGGIPGLPAPPYSRRPPGFMYVLLPCNVSCQPREAVHWCSCREHSAISQSPLSFAALCSLF